MLKAGLMGVGAMGRGHLENFIRYEKEGFPVKLAAICDIDPDKLKGIAKKGNMGVGTSNMDMTKYNLYTDMDEMFEKELLDFVVIALPTFIHHTATIKALNKGIHVMCEKPMAIDSEKCQQMIDASIKNKRKLMAAQCLRFWPAYEYLKDYTQNKKFGDVISAYFFRGGGTPLWSWENWLLTKERSQGCLLDQHIHDVDMVNYLFGKPDRVSTTGRRVFPTSGYDAVSANYIYDGFDAVINAQDDWTINGEFGFEMIFRVNFEKGSIVFTRSGLMVYPNEGKGFAPELEKNDGYFRELRYFMDAITNDTEITIASPASTRDTIKIAEAEIKSADNKGEIVKVL